MRRAFVHLLNLLFSHVVEDVREAEYNYVVRTMGNEFELALFIGPLKFPAAASGLFMGRSVKVRFVRNVSSLEEARSIVRLELERHKVAAAGLPPVVPIRMPR
jgi:hypothetical protein